MASVKIQVPFFLSPGAYIFRYTLYNMLNITKKNPQTFVSRLNR